MVEAILGVEFDRRNFQRKILSSGILEEAGPQEYSGGPGLEPRFCVEEMQEDCLAPATRKFADIFNKVVPLPTVAGIDAAPRPKKGRQGRPGILFRLNRKRYEEMKEEGGKMEF